MEERIREFSKSVGTFCNQLQSSCGALKQSVDRRPIPLDSATSTFIQNLNRRVSSACGELNRLETMSFGTVSFEELLGHCYQVYNTNQTHLLLLQHLLPPGVDSDDDEDQNAPLAVELESESDLPSSLRTISRVLRSFEDDPLMDESLSLRSMGLSDVCLATLAANGKTDGNDSITSKPDKLYDEQFLLKKGLHDFTDMIELQYEGGLEGDQTPATAPCAIVKVSKDDYESLPSSLKCLASWEDLLVAVEKINSSLRKKGSTAESNYFNQDELTLLGLGPKARTYLLLLRRMNLLVIETIGGSICYKIL